MSTDFILMLDLDSTLIHSSSDFYEYNKLIKNDKAKPYLYRFDLVDTSERLGSGDITKIWGVFRPHLRSFLEFALLYFKDIVIWSAGQFNYVYSIVDFIFDGFDYFPKIIKTYDDCEFHNRNVFKKISKLDLDMSKVIAIDDRKDTFHYNPNNGIQIPPYEPSPTLDDIEDDYMLVKLMCWFCLPEVKNSDDIRRVNKKDIFTRSFTEYSKKLAISYTPT